MTTKKLTDREKHYAAASNPLCEGTDMTAKELKRIQRKARGHYWDETSAWAIRNGCEFDQFCAYSPSGKRRYFGPYEFYSWASNSLKKKWKAAFRLAAKLWAEGKVKDSRRVEQFVVANSHNEDFDLKHALTKSRDHYC